LQILQVYPDTFGWGSDENVFSLLSVGDSKAVTSGDCKGSEINLLDWCSRVRKTGRDSILGDRATSPKKGELLQRSRGLHGA